MAASTRELKALDERQAKINRLKDRCLAVERRMEARNIIVAAEVLHGQMAVRIIGFAGRSPLAPSAIDSVWLLSKAEDWLDKHPMGAVPSTDKTWKRI